VRQSVAIIGAGLGGLSAAIHLRLAGYPVTIFEVNTQTGGRANRIQQGGFTFDTGPSLLNYPWVFEELFSAAGRDFRDYVKLLPVNPSVEFRWADGQHFQLSSDMKALLAECERIEPGSGPGLTAFFADAAEKYRLSFDKLVTRNEDNPLRWILHLSAREMWATGVWRSLDGELNRFFRSRYIREAFGSYGMYLGGSPFDLPGVFSILPYGELAYGLWLPKGGIYSLVQGIERLARELGVRILTNTKVTQIRREAGRVTGLELENGDRRDFPIVVSNVDVPTTQRTLLDIPPGTSRKTKMTPGVLTFYWGVRGRVENIGHHTIFLPDDYKSAFDDLCSKGRIPAGLPFYISIPSETDHDLAPPGDSAVFVLVPTPLLSEMPRLDWNAAVHDIRRRVLDRIGLDESRIAVEHIWTPAEWRHRFGLHDGSAFGAAHTLFQVGPFRSRNYSREIEGLYYTGAGTTPGTGMPMVTLSGRMTAERIEAHAR
jgi:phytoene desaturase